MAFLLEKYVEGVASECVLEEVGECIMYWLEKWWQRKELVAEKEELVAEREELVAEKE